MILVLIVIATWTVMMTIVAVLVFCPAVRVRVNTVAGVGFLVMWQQLMALNRCGLCIEGKSLCILS